MSDIERSTPELDLEIQTEVLLQLLNNPSAMEELLANRRQTSRNSASASAANNKQPGYGAGWPIVPGDKGG